MFKKAKLWVILLVVLVMAASVLAGCGTPKDQSKPDTGQKSADKSNWPQKTTLASGPTGGFSYLMGSPWASTVGTSIGITISSESTAGLPVDAIMVNNKQAEIGVCSTDVAYDGWYGAEWTNGQKLENIRGMMVFDPNVIQIYTDKKSGITNISGLTGKSVNPSRAKSNCDTIFRRIADELGIKPARITNQNPTDANGQLGDGLLDAAAAMGNVPHPAVSEYETNHEITLLGLSKEQAQKFCEKFPALSIYEIPANTYKNQKEPVISVGSYVMYVVSKDLPDSMVYEMVKATFDKKNDLASAYKPFSLMDAKNILYSPIPLHPGSIKYFEEQGIKIPDNLKPAK